MFLILVPLSFILAPFMMLLGLVLVVGAFMLAHLAVQHLVAAGFALAGISDIYDWEVDGKAPIEQLEGFQEVNASWRQALENMQAWVDLNRSALEKGIQLKLARQDWPGAWQDARRLSASGDQRLRAMEAWAWEAHMNPVWVKLQALDRHDDGPKLIERIRAAAAERQAKAEQARQQQMHQARLDAALKRLATRMDRRKGVIRYYDRSMPPDRNQTGMTLYIEKTLHEELLSDWDQPVHLVIRLQFVPKRPVRRGLDEDERYWHHAEVEADDQSQRYESLQWRGRVLEDVDSYGHDERDIRAIQAIIRARKSVVRFDIDGDIHEVPITKAQKATFQRVLDAFEALGGRVLPEKK